MNMECSRSVDRALRCSSSWKPDREMYNVDCTMTNTRLLIRPRSASCSVVTCRREVRRIAISPNESGSSPTTRTSWSPARRSRKRRKQSGNACRLNWRIQRISFAVCNNSQTTIDSVTHQLLFAVHRPLNRCYTCSSKQQQPLRGDPQLHQMHSTIGQPDSACMSHHLGHSRGIVGKTTVTVTEQM